jgi:hypothetical protein
MLLGWSVILEPGHPSHDACVVHQDDGDQSCLLPG